MSINEHLNPYIWFVQRFILEFLAKRSELFYNRQEFYCLESSKNWKCHCTENWLFYISIVQFHCMTKESHSIFSWWNILLLSSLFINFHVKEPFSVSGVLIQYWRNCALLMNSFCRIWRIYIGSILRLKTNGFERTRYNNGASVAVSRLLYLLVTFHWRLIGKTLPFVQQTWSKIVRNCKQIQTFSVRIIVSLYQIFHYILEWKEVERQWQRPH